MIEEDKQKAENEQKNKELADCYKRMAKTDDGKIIMADLEIFCGAKRIAADKDWNAYKTFFHDGMRNIYLYINTKIDRKERENGDQS